MKSMFVIFISLVTHHDICLAPMIFVNSYGIILQIGSTCYSMLINIQTIIIAAFSKTEYVSFALTDRTIIFAEGACVFLFVWDICVFDIPRGFTCYWKINA